MANETAKAIVTFKEFKALVKKFGGWTENGIAYFPSVYLKEQFEKAFAGGKD